MQLKLLLLAVALFAVGQGLPHSIQSLHAQLLQGRASLPQDSTAVDVSASLLCKDAANVDISQAFNAQLADLQASYAHTTAQNQLLDELRTQWTTTNTVPETVQRRASLPQDPAIAPQDPESAPQDPASAPQDLAGTDDVGASTEQIGAASADIEQAFQAQLADLQASYAQTTAEKNLLDQLKTQWTTTNSVPEKVQRRASLPQDTASVSDIGAPST